MRLRSSSLRLSSARRSGFSTLSGNLFALLLVRIGIPAGRKGDAEAAHGGAAILAILQDAHGHGDRRQRSCAGFRRSAERGRLWCFRYRWRWPSRYSGRHRWRPWAAIRAQIGIVGFDVARTKGSFAASGHFGFDFSQTRRGPRRGRRECRAGFVLHDLDAEAVHVSGAGLESNGVSIVIGVGAAGDDHAFAGPCVSPRCRCRRRSR